MNMNIKGKLIIVLLDVEAGSVCLFVNKMSKL